MATTENRKNFQKALAQQFHRSGLSALIRFALGGIVIGLLVSATATTVRHFVEITTDNPKLRMVFLMAYFYGGLAVPACILLSARSWIARFLRSSRIDLILASAIGICVSLSFHSNISKYISVAISQFTGAQLTYLLILPLGLLTILFATALLAIWKAPKNNLPATFFNDGELNSLEDDLLDVRPDAIRFAERVLNGGSKESMVFGLDAPWGAGKSSFINFCETWWKARPEKDVLVYRFSPLQYEDRKSLLSKFVDGLISTIREKLFVPELDSTVSRYADLFKGEKQFSFWGVDFTLGAPSVTIEYAHNEVSKVLGTLPKRVIVIIDDLDRMEFEAVKDILYVIKKCFSFPNLSFVLCYDTQNIALFGDGPSDTTKISEFLEKFVNVKQGLFPTAESLKKYLTEGRKLAAAKNPLSDPKLLDQAVGFPAQWDPKLGIHVT